MTARFRYGSLVARTEGHDDTMTAQTELEEYVAQRATTPMSGAAAQHSFLVALAEHLLVREPGSPDQARLTSACLRFLHRGTDGRPKR